MRKDKRYSRHGRQHCGCDTVTNRQHLQLHNLSASDRNAPKNAVGTVQTDESVLECERCHAIPVRLNVPQVTDVSLFVTWSTVVFAEGVQMWARRQATVCRVPILTQNGLESVRYNCFHGDGEPNWIWNPRDERGSRFLISPETVTGALVDDWLNVTVPVTDDESLLRTTMA